MAFHGCSALSRAFDMVLTELPLLHRLADPKQRLGEVTATEYDYSWLYFADCNTTLVVECRLEEGCDRLEEVVCPGCGAGLGQVRANDGYDFIGMACGYLYPGKPCFGADS